jgi:hypothetical protein
MYPILLTVHSLFRWIVLISLLYALFRGYKGWLTRDVFSGFDDKVRHTTATIAHVQLLIGLGLYWLSPLVIYFRNHFGEAVGQREIRFFGMEHSTMMFIAIVVISIGSSMAKRKQLDGQKFKTMALWFSFALLIILLSIPWPFSPLANRPYFRPF